MNTLRLVERLEARAESFPFECEIIRADISVTRDAAIVTLKRLQRPEERAYSTHYYAGCNDGLHHGHYDMTYETAMSDHTDRAMREWG